MFKKMAVLLLVFFSLNVHASESDPEDLSTWLQSEADPLPGQQYSYTDTVFSIDEESLYGTDLESSDDESESDADKENQSPNESGR